MYNLLATVYNCITILFIITTFVTLHVLYGNLTTHFVNIGCNVHGCFLLLNIIFFFIAVDRNSKNYIIANLLKNVID